MQLRRNVLEQVGLPIAVGVARTKFLAKVASGVAKPDGLLLVPPDGELAFFTRFGTAAITRAVLLGRDQFLSVPLLPD